MGKVLAGLTEDQKTRTVELYMSGESIPQIGQRLQVSPTTINHLLRRRSVVLQGPRETSTRRQLRHDAFDERNYSEVLWSGSRLPW